MKEQDLRIVHNDWLKKIVDICRKSGQMRFRYVVIVKTRTIYKRKKPQGS